MKIIFEVEGEYNILDKTGKFLLGQVISSAECLGILVSAWKQVMWLEQATKAIISSLCLQASFICYLVNKICGLCIEVLSCKVSSLDLWTDGGLRSN